MIQMSFAFQLRRMYWIIQIFNFYGILSITKEKNTVKVSKFHAVLNAIKILALIIFKDDINRLVEENVSMSYYEMSLTPFSEFYLSIFGNQAKICCILIMTLQLIMCRKNAKLINNIIKFTFKFVETSAKTEDHFDFYKRKCRRNIKILLIIFGGCSIYGYFTSMRLSLHSVPAYLFYSLYYFIITAFLCYFYVCQQFLIFSHESLNFYAIELLKNDSKANIENISVLKSLLFSIRTYFLSTTSRQALIFMFFSMIEVIEQVITAQYF